MPASRSRIAPNTLGESKRGRQSHSTLPPGATRAQVAQSERKPYSAIGGNGLAPKPPSVSKRFTTERVGERARDAPIAIQEPVDSRFGTPSSKRTT
jgi:hypothetical protein